MAFSEETIAEAFERSGGRCECNRGVCATHYLTRCPTYLSVSSAVFRRKKLSTFGDPDKPSNCEVVCPMCSANAEADIFAP